MQKISPMLWFDSKAEEAVDHYVSIFKEAEKLEVSHYLEGSPGPTGSVLTVRFKLFGEEFLALNGGPMFSFTPAISFVIHCEDQAEVDMYWAQLSEGGEEGHCGWLTDKFGLSWQVIPDLMLEYVNGNDPVKSKRAMDAMLQMRKLDLSVLQNAYEGE